MAKDDKSTKYSNNQQKNYLKIFNNIFFENLKEEVKGKPSKYERL